MGLEAFREEQEARKAAREAQKSEALPPEQPESAPTIEAKKPDIAEESTSSSSREETPLDKAAKELERHLRNTSDDAQSVQLAITNALPKKMGKEAKQALRDNLTAYAIRVGILRTESVEKRGKAKTVLRKGTQRK